MESAKKERTAGNNQVMEIDLLSVIQILLKRIGWIILAAFVIGACAFIFTKAFITPTYRSKFTAYVNNRASDSESVSTMSNADLSASQSLVKTYAEIITSSSVLEAAAADAGMNLEYDDLFALVETEISTGTEIITIYVQAYSPAQAKSFAQAISEQAQTQIAAIVDGTSMRVIDQPSLPQGKFAPSCLKNTVIAAFIGALLACFVIVVIYMMDDTLRDEKTLGEKYDIPILGLIPNYESAAQESHRGGYGYGYGAAAARSQKQNTSRSGSESSKSAGNAKQTTRTSAKTTASRSRERS